MRACTRMAGHAQERQGMHKNGMHTHEGMYKIGKGCTRMACTLKRECTRMARHAQEWHAYS